MLEHACSHQLCKVSHPHSHSCGLCLPILSSSIGHQRGSSVFQQYIASGNCIVEIIEHTLWVLLIINRGRSCWIFVASWSDQWLPQILDNHIDNSHMLSYFYIPLMLLHIVPVIQHIFLRCVWYFWLLPNVFYDDLQDILTIFLVYLWGAGGILPNSPCSLKVAPIIHSVNKRLSITMSSSLPPSTLIKLSCLLWSSCYSSGA